MTQLIKARHAGKIYTAVYAAPECQPPHPPDPWTPYELTRAMQAVGWRPLPQPGCYIHAGTYCEIDINEPDEQGDPVWLTWAVARLTPPPF